MNYSEALWPQNVSLRPLYYEGIEVNDRFGYEIMKILDIKENYPIVTVRGAGGEWIRLKFDRYTTSIYYPTIDADPFQHNQIKLHDFLTKAYYVDDRYKIFRTYYDDYINKRYNDCGFLLIPVSTVQSIWINGNAGRRKVKPQIMTVEEEKKRDDDCDKWASEGECEKNPTYMNTKCANACNKLKSVGGKRRSKSNNKPKKSAKRSKRAKSRRTRRQRK